MVDPLFATAFAGGALIFASLIFGMWTSDLPGNKYFNSAFTGYILGFMLILLASVLYMRRNF